MHTRIFALTITLLLLAVPMLTRAEASDSPWTLEQHCLPAPVHLPEGQVFAGNIFTADAQGIHVSRTDRNTSYIIAFEGRNFTPSGDVSPDGRWFAVPYGRMEYSSMLENRYLVTEWRVYSTGVDQEYYTVPFSRYDERVSADVLYARDDRFLPRVTWVDNEHFVYPLSMARRQNVLMINPFSKDVALLDADWYRLARSYNMSPDASRDLTRDVTQNSVLVDSASKLPLATMPFDGRAVWSPDSAGFLYYPVGDTQARVMWIDRDGKTSEALPLPPDKRVDNIEWSPDGTQFALTVRQPDDSQNVRLYTGDFVQKRLIDKCTPVNINDLKRMEWSPDGERLAFHQSIQGREYLMIVHFRSGEFFWTDYTPGRLVDWMPG